MAQEPGLVLGIDPGLQITGYGLLRPQPSGTELVEAGVLEGGSASLPLPARLRNLYEALISLMDEFQPGTVAMEQLYSHYAHPRTAILMGHARGVLNLAAAMGGATVVDYSATQVKSSLTGNGRASKQQVQRAIRQALRLDADPDPPDVADALAIALCHLHHVRDLEGTR